jgi:PPM family protein phosphatase
MTHGSPVEEVEIGGAVLAFGTASDVGNVRALNEDAVLAAPPVFAVADGMGGHDAGEVASALTVQRLAALAENAPVTMEALSEELQHVNFLLRAATEPGSASGMGTTVVGFALVEHGGAPAWLVFNVGDSRAYGLADGVLVQLTHDHSYVQELVDSGRLDAEDARAHPHRNVVTRALGADHEVRPDYWVRPVIAGERLLLCSDGLSGEVDDATIAGVLAAGLPPDETVRTLIALALTNGGRDNVTALVLDVVAVAALDEPTTETRPGHRRRVRGGTAVLDRTEVDGADLTVPRHAGHGTPLVPPVSAVPEVLSGSEPDIAGVPAPARPSFVPPPPDGLIELVPRVGIGVDRVPDAELPLLEGPPESLVPTHSSSPAPGDGLPDDLIEMPPDLAGTTAGARDHDVRSGTAMPAEQSEESPGAQS